MSWLSLNNENLPYPDTIHPIVVHFVIAMVFFAYVCDIAGFLNRNHRLFEVSWWNMVVASVAVFFAVMFGEFEAALAMPYPAAEATLDLHTINGWSLSVLLVALSAWRGVIRVRDPLRVPVLYLGFATVLISMISLQIYLGDLLDWVYGLHGVAVVEATRQGVLP